jgi:hypothetical protein
MSTIIAKFLIKDAEGNVLKDDEGKNTYETASADYNFGADLNELIALCSDEVVRSNAIANITVTLQSRIRSLKKAGNSPDQIQAGVDKFVPGVAAPKVAVDPLVAAASLFSTMSDEKKKEFLKSLEG